MKLQQTSVLFLMFVAVLGMPLESAAISQQRSVNVATTDTRTSKAETGEPLSSAARLDPLAVEAFADGYFPKLMEQRRVPGAVFAVVSREGIILKKGYGVANTETSEPVDPDKHLFRIASASKTFAAVSIMRLVEEGKLDLKTNIRTYVPDIEIDDSKGPITISDLLGHSSGFESRVYNRYGVAPALLNLSTVELFNYFAPKQLRAPRTLTGYSNYGYSLLGEIVARASGVPYAKYVEETILKPLRMDRSTYRLRVSNGDDDDAKTAALREEEVKGHTWERGGYVVKSFPIAFPETTDASGGLSTTAGNMVRYIRMYLNDGALDGARILKPQTMSKMQSVAFANGPYGDAMAHGLFRSETALGKVVLGHGGSINNNMSQMTFVPELGLGIFMSTNSDGGWTFTDVPIRLIEAFFPEEKQLHPKVSPPDDFADRVDRYIGTYFRTRRTETGSAKIRLINQTVDVSVMNDRYLLLNNGDMGRYVEEKPDVFVSVEDGRRIEFQGPPGKKATMIIGSGSVSAFERSTFDKLSLSIFPFVGAALLAAIAALAGQVVFFFRPPAFVPTMMQRIAQSVFVLTSVLLLISIIQFIMAFEAFDAIYDVFPSPELIAFNYFIIMGTAGTGLLALLLVPVLRGTGWGIGRKAQYAFSTIIFAAALFAAYQWNILPVSS
ncbi:MAG: serine hydrolase domain-containing protein [Pseudomonadota bacterium]